MIRPRIAGAARRFSSAAARVAQYEPPQVELLSCIAPPTLSRLLAIENEAFPPCERLGSVLLPQTALQRNNGLLVAHAEEDFAGYLLFSRTAEESIIMKLAVEAAHRGCGVGSMLLRRAIEELEQPTRRGDARPIVAAIQETCAAALVLSTADGCSIDWNSLEPIGFSYSTCSSSFFSTLSVVERAVVQRSCQQRSQ